MVAFNPNVPDTQDPNYLSYSRGTSQQEGSKVAGTALAALGNVLDASVKGLDFINKDTIDKTLYSQIDAERDAYTQALVDTTIPTGQAPAKRQNARETESYQAMDILPNASQASIPTDLQNLPRTLGNLAGGYSNGKISNTYYYGRLNSIAKDVRSRYPGYREYIDKQIAEVTGVNPANAYMTSLVGDINQALTQARSEKDKTLALIDKYIGIPGAPQIRQGFQNGTISDQGVRQWVHNREVWDNYYALQRQRREYETGNRTEAAVTATANMHSESHKDVALHLDTITLATMGDGTSEKLLERINAGKPLSGPDAVLAAQELQRQKVVMEKKLWDKFSKKDASGQSDVDRVGGPEKAKAIIADNLKIFDNYSNLMATGDFTQANQAARRAKALIDDQKLLALNDGKVGKPLVMLEILKSTGGEPFVAQYYKTLLKSGFSEAFINYTEALELPMMTQPNMTPQGTGTIVTGNDQLTKARQAGVDTPELTKAVVDRLASIADPSIPIEVRLKLARAAFSEGNRGFISRFALDDVQITQDGRRRIVPGRVAVFQQLTSPQMTSEMMKISGKHPDIWRDYVNWTTHTFGNELFRREINDLRSFQRMEGVTVRYNTGESGGSPRFTVDFQEDRMSGSRPAGAGGPANPMMGMTSTTKAEIQASVERLNRGLAGVHNVLKNNSEDTEGYLLQTLTGLNVDFTGQSFGGQEIKGLPEDFRQAIINSRRPPTPAPRPSDAGSKGEGTRKRVIRAPIRPTPPSAGTMPQNLLERTFGPIPVPSSQPYPPMGDERGLQVQGVP